MKTVIAMDKDSSYVFVIDCTFVGICKEHHWPRSIAAIGLEHTWMVWWGSWWTGGQSFETHRERPQVL